MHLKEWSKCLGLNFVSQIRTARIEVQDTVAAKSAEKNTEGLLKTEHSSKITQLLVCFVSLSTITLHEKAWRSQPERPRLLLFGRRGSAFFARSG
jgi:hypothetical protein